MNQHEEVSFPMPTISYDDAVTQVSCEMLDELASYARMLANYETALQYCISAEDFLQIAVEAFLRNVNPTFNLQQMRKYARLRGKGAMIDELRKAMRRVSKNVSLDYLTDEYGVFV